MFGGSHSLFGETWRLRQAAKVACWYASTGDIRQARRDDERLSHGDARSNNEGVASG